MVVDELTSARCHLAIELITHQTCSNNGDWIQLSVSDFNAKPEVTMPLEVDGYDDFSHAQTAPDEVLFIIFNQLELRDRLAARLVCRKWYDVCHDVRFHKKEKFSIEQLYQSSVQDVLEFFTNVHREHLSFEFHGLTFQEDFPPFWEACGPKISSLFFMECNLSILTFWHIVTNCTSLQKLTLSVCEHVGARGNQTRELDLHTIVESGDVNTSLRCMELHFRGSKHQWSRWFVQFFQLFPRITRFTFFGSEYVWDYEIMNPAHLVAINETIFSRARMEELRLVTYQYQYRELDWTVLASLQLTMLTEVAVHVNDSTDRLLLASFLGRQRNLEILHFLLRSSFRSAVMDEAFDIIFQQCPRLKDLELTSVCRFSWRAKWFDLLAKSSVTSLRVECDDIIFPEMKAYPENTTMRKLELHFKSFFNSSTLPLIEAFTLLKELVIFKVTDKIMSTVLEQQKRLSLLDVRYRARLVSKITNEQFEVACRSPLDFSSLRVDHLSLPADLPRYPNFLSPCLKHLHLYSPMSDVYYSPISLNTESSPLLEEVIIDTCCFSYPFTGTFTENILRFIQPLKRLRYFYISSRSRMVYSKHMPYLDDDFIQMMFGLCPALRCFVYKRIYFRNNLNRDTLTIADLDEHSSRTSSRVYKSLHLPSARFSLKL